ncbi:MAG: deoxyribonuclease IV [Candidatus Kapaibacterium sp.]
MPNHKAIKEKEGPLLGVHVSTVGGLLTSFDRAETLGINTFQLFVKSNKQWFAPKELSDEEISAFRERRKRWNARGPIVAHGCYLLNLGSSDPAIQNTSRESFVQELTRADALGIDHFVFHPGSHGGNGEESAIANIAEALNWIHSQTPEVVTKTVLEGTAGQGSAVGHRFEHLEAILSKILARERVRVCLDTCHIFAAGYDIRTVDAWERTFREFHARIGLDQLACIHTNDSKKGFATRVDRHEHIGEGQIGLEAFRLLMNDQRLKHIPKILETPKDEAMTEDFQNLALLRSLKR